ncbi:hypothetical protein HBN50_02170 [Halobacteriovorax sp. GB3]|uniref:hypothetical protein n=1 Tax=Halobacteriovorax sp. GB3 TaxID=2719615 RepID=UPI0023626ACD|nr:hypothetical protein [Halobacteriovorax sp. GB3]MDD0851878.1 hypothetical protein [Halobacteriovorax sp. GB3]
MNEFIEKIIATLESNGFPQKRVSLPVEKMYEAADNRGLNFNNVLEKMKADHQIDYTIETEKVVFEKSLAQDSAFGDMSKEDMMKQANDMMSSMSPEQLRALQEQFANMSEQEKADLMQKGREMGLI